MTQSGHPFYGVRLTILRRLLHGAIGIAALILGIITWRSEGFANLLNKDFVGDLLYVFSGGFLLGGSLLVFGAWREKSHWLVWTGYAIVGTDFLYQWYLGYLW